MKTVHVIITLPISMDGTPPESRGEFVDFTSQVTKYWALLSDQATRILSAEDQCGQHKCCLSTPQPLFLAVSYRLPKSGNCRFWRKV